MKRNTIRRAAALALAAGLALQPLAYATAAYAEEAVAASEESSTTEASSAVVMERLYNRWTGEHLYTSSKAEVADLTGRGWKDEGTAWYAPATSSTPVYRLYNPYSSDHHYTTSKDEYDKCAKAGWRKEGVAWYSADSKSVPLYRGYNPYETVGTHHYTTSSSEMSTMAKAGWRAEGVAWYGLKATLVKAAYDEPTYGKKWVVDQEAYDEHIDLYKYSFYTTGPDGYRLLVREFRPCDYDYDMDAAYEAGQKWAKEDDRCFTYNNGKGLSYACEPDGVHIVHHEEVGHWETVQTGTTHHDAVYKYE